MRQLMMLLVLAVVANAQPCTTADRTCLERLPLERLPQQSADGAQMWPSNAFSSGALAAARWRVYHQSVLAAPPRQARSQ